MARRKAQRKKTTHRRRRRVSGVDAGGMLMTAATVLGGVVIAGIANKTVLANKSDMVKGLVPIAAGIVLPMAIKGEMGKNIGLGLIAAGGSVFLKKANLAGLGSDDDMLAVPISVSGDGEVLSIAGTGDDLIMAGTSQEALQALAGMGLDDDE